MGGRLSESRQKKGEACQEPRTSLCVSAPHGPSSQAGVSLLFWDLPSHRPICGPEFPSIPAQQSLPHIPCKSLGSWAQPLPSGRPSAMGRQSVMGCHCSFHSRERPWPSSSVTLAALGTLGRAPPRSTVTRPSQDAWCLGNSSSLRPGPPLPRPSSSSRVWGISTLAHLLFLIVGTFGILRLRSLFWRCTSGPRC